MMLMIISIIVIMIMIRRKSKMNQMQNLKLRSVEIVQECSGLQALSLCHTQLWRMMMLCHQKVPHNAVNGNLLFPVKFLSSLSFIYYFSLFENNTVAIKKGQESYDLLKASCKGLLNAINKILTEGKVTVDGKEISIEMFLGGDYKVTYVIAFMCK